METKDMHLTKTLVLSTIDIQNWIKFELSNSSVFTFDTPYSVRLISAIPGTNPNTGDILLRLEFEEVKAAS